MFTREAFITITFYKYIIIIIKVLHLKQILERKFF